jgi:hypothetical protein
MTGAAGGNPSRLPRRSFGLRDKLEVMVKQARCTLCQEKLGSLEDLHWDHLIPLALGGSDSPDNLQAVHRACHDRKTRGLPATTAGSDIHLIAKVKRIVKDPPGGEEFRRKLLQRDPKPEQDKKHKWPKRPFPKKAPRTP